MVSHAFFKRALFLIVGGRLHFIFSQQDRRRYGICFNYRVFYRLVLFICVLCLCGLFFVRGFVRKDFFIDFITKRKKGMALRTIFIFRLILTFFYSTRLLLRVFLKTNTRFIVFSKFSVPIIIRPLTLIRFSVFFRLWNYNNFNLFFNPLVKEKQIFLNILCFFIIIMIIILMVFKFLKNMFLLDVIIKKLGQEKLKLPGFFEKTSLDIVFLNTRSYLVFLFRVLINGLLKEKKIVFFLGFYIVVMIFLFFYLFSL